MKVHLRHLSKCLIILRQSSNRTNKIDYQNKPNTYESWYSPDWRIEAKNQSLLRWYSCVRNMIEHMVSETKRVFKGTTHEDSYLFYHDSLILITAKETVSRWNKRDTKNCGSYLKWIYFPANPSSNATEVVHLRIARNFVILITVQTKICTRQCIVMLGIHIHCINYIRKSLVLQQQRKEHQITLRSLIRFTVLLHQANGSYQTHMMYSH